MNEGVKRDQPITMRGVEPGVTRTYGPRLAPEDGRASDHEPNAHAWEAFGADCAQIGIVEFRRCATCGVLEGLGGEFSFLDGSDAHFDGKDCPKAQEQLRFYLLGRIHGLFYALEGPDPEGRAIVALLKRALDAQRPNTAIVEALKQAQNIKGRPGPQAIQTTLGLM